MSQSTQCLGSLVPFLEIFLPRYHKYYQWVCFTLFFQAILFYIPRQPLMIQHECYQSSSCGRLDAIHLYIKSEIDIYKYK